MIVLEILLILIFLSFPFLLWWYGMTFLSENIWNRQRFISGLIGGSLAVGVIAIFGKLWFSSSSMGKISLFLLLFLVVGVFVWWITSSGSPFIRWFLRRALLIHSALFCCVFCLVLFLWKVLPVSGWVLIILSSLGGFLFAASIEEWVKHLSTIGLTSKEFRFTRRDFLLFTFFVTLWFSTFETALYLFKEMENGLIAIFLVWISRILFSLTIHVFAASICVMMWWKALTYSFFSYKYILFFVLWYASATLIHGLYNLLLDRNYIIPIIVLTGVGYFSITQWMDGSSEK